jgi:hypothetical protein
MKKSKDEISFNQYASNLLSELIKVKKDFDSINEKFREVKIEWESDKLAIQDLSVSVFNAEKTI